MYVVAANGSTDFSSPTTPDLGESYIQLNTSRGLAVADYFTPFNYAQLNSATWTVVRLGWPFWAMKQAVRRTHT
jgi:hypothetical protein